MYLCFESDDKRSMFPESSLISVDENGFTVKSFTGTKPGSNLAFFRMDSFQGVVGNFQQGLSWVKRMPQRPKGNAAASPKAASLPSEPKF